MQIALDMVNASLLASVLAVALNLLLGYSGQISVAHAALAGVGAYTATLLSIHLGLPFAGCVLAGVAVAAVAGLVVGLPALGLRDEYLILLTLCAGAVFTGVVSSVAGLGGAYGLLGVATVEVAGIELLRPAEWFPLIAVFAAVVLVLCAVVVRSPFGRVLRAIKDDEPAARSLGLAVDRTKLFVFVVSAGLAGAGGALYSFYNQLTSPSLWDFTRTLLVIIMVIVGGSGTIVGSVLGATLVTIAPQLLEKVGGLPADQAGTYSQIGFAVLLVLVVVVRPGGIVSVRDGAPAVRWPFRVQALPGPESVIAGTTRVEVRGAQKSFGGVVALADVSLALPVGRISALVGPNGAGKTTLFNALCGFVPLDAGHVLVDGEDVGDAAPERRARLGLVRSFQDVRTFSSMSPLDNVATGVPRRRGNRMLDPLLHPRRVRADEAAAVAVSARWLDYVGVSDTTGVAVGTMSFGEQKLVALARTLATGADVLLLDEPLSGVDGEWVDRTMAVLESLRSDGHTICIVEHSLAVVDRLADVVFFMESGALTATGTVRELLARNDLAELYFGAGATS